MTMVELRTKITESGVLYIPKELRDAFGREMKIVTNCTAALFFPANAEYQDVIKSVKIIMLDLEQRDEMKKKIRKE